MMPTSTCEAHLRRHDAAGRASSGRTAPRYFRRKFPTATGRSPTELALVDLLGGAEISGEVGEVRTGRTGRRSDCTYWRIDCLLPSSGYWDRRFPPRLGPAVSVPLR
jgi:hypothetical protein